MTIRAAIVSGLLLSAMIFAAYADKSEPVAERRAFSQLPEQIGSWTQADSSEIESNVLKVLGVDDYVNRQYSRGENGSIGLYIGYYRSQRQGDTMHSPLNCLPGAGWNPIKKQFAELSIPHLNPIDGEPASRIRINRIVIQRGMERQLVYYWYQSHGRVIASEYWGKIYTVIDAIRTNRTDAALIRVIHPIRNMEDAAEKTADENAVDFIKSMFPLLGDFLPN